MALTVDGTNTTANSTTTTITTTKANDIILLFAAGDNNTGYNPVTSVTDAANLTWHQAAGPVEEAHADHVTGDLYWAFSSGILTNNTITAHGKLADGRLMVMAINGANTTTPLDTNASNPITNTQASGASVVLSGMTTNNPNTMLVTWARTDDTLGQATQTPSGYTQDISGGSFTGMYRKIVSSVQSNVAGTISFSGTTSGVGIFVAIQAALPELPWMRGDH